MERKMRLYRGLFFGLLGSVLAGVILGAADAGRDAGGDPGGTYRKLNVFARVLTYVQNNYVEEIEDDKLIYSAIRGMVGTLDNHSIFLTPDQYKDMKDDTSGEFGGLGVEIHIRDGYPTVVAPIDDTPASRAGLKTDDQIVEIEGRNTRNLDIFEVRRLLKGPAGSKVTFKIMRKGFKEPVTHTLIREQIRMKSVESRMLEPGFGYVKIKSFQEHSYRQMEDALTQLTKQAGGALRGLVLDMRNNPGGLFEQSVRIADMFVDEGVIVSTEGRSRKAGDKEMAHPKGTQPHYPMIVIVNGGSASAAEIVAGALQDHKRALVVGTPSYGKGSVQTIIELEDHSALKLTIAKYFTPNHRSIQDHGIAPDVIIDEPLTLPTGEKPAKDGKDAAAPEKDKEPKKKPHPFGDDTQLREAFGCFKDWDALMKAGKK
ncbi:MAG: S41 family peptidase [Deltaproteobacteria bacterium]|nr:S41 family peptidase [Deltaproteobacteria bacterium]